MKFEVKDTTPTNTIKLHYPHILLKIIFGFHDFNLEAKAFVRLNSIQRDEVGKLIISKEDKNDIISKVKKKMSKKFNGTFPKALKYCSIYSNKIQDYSTPNGTRYLESWIISKTYNDKNQLVECF